MKENEGRLGSGKEKFIETITGPSGNIHILDDGHNARHAHVVCLWVWGNA